MAEKKDKKAAKKAKKKTKPLISKILTLIHKKKAKGTKSKAKREERNRRSGPRLPSSLHRELEVLNPNARSPRNESDGEEGGMGEDFYEYEEEIPEEESKKNRHYDLVENYEYELPEEFLNLQDEDVPSDDDDEEIPSDKSDDGAEGSDRHIRMLQGITGMPDEAFEGKSNQLDFKLKARHFKLDFKLKVRHLKMRHFKLYSVESNQIELDTLKPIASPISCNSMSKILLSIPRQE